MDGGVELVEGFRKAVRLGENGDMFVMVERKCLVETWSRVNVRPCSESDAHLHGHQRRRVLGEVASQVDGQTVKTR